MKKINLFLLSSLVLGVISCSSDDSTPGVNDAEINAVEQTTLDANMVSQGITIDGATKSTGDLTPNSNINFTPAETTQSAFLKNGFDIRMSVPANYAGAYVRVVSEDGTEASDYFDIPGTATRAPKNKKTSLLHKKASKMMENEVEIDVDFSDAVTPGKFCYILCIYDTDGNISQPSEICVEVEAWGGNSNLAGSWKLVKSEYTYDGIEETQVVGVEDCDETTIFCADQTEIVAENCDTLNSLVIVFNADGTYRFDSDETYTNVDYDKSTESCSPIYEEEKNDTSYSIGQWAYDEEEKVLTLVEFEYLESSLEGQVETIKEGELLFTGALDFAQTTFTLFEEDTFQGQTEINKIYFTK